MTFVVELKNVSDQAIKLLGVRYGDNVSAPWPGKSKSDWFAPLLFDCEFFDENGRPVDRADRKLLAADAALATDSRMETIEPDKTLTVLIRPAQWSHCMEHRLGPGTYRVRVHYRGPSTEVVEILRRIWPDRPATTAWTGDAVSGEVTFTIADDPARKRQKLVWGEPKDGLAAAVEFRSLALHSRADSVKRSDDRGDAKKGSALESQSTAAPHGTKFNVCVHVKNVGDRTVQFWSEAWRQGDKCTVRDEAGGEQQLGGGWYSGWTIMVHWTLKPGQVAELSLPDFGIAADAESAEKFAHPIGPVLVAKPGKYGVRYELRFDGIQRKDSDGNVVVPGKDDWQGTITTGQTPFIVRAATPEDRARLDPTFTGLIEFVAADGKPIERGEAEVWAPTRNNRTKIAIKSGPVGVPDCPPQPVIVDVRAPGFEEKRFYDVTLRSDANYKVQEGDTLSSIAAAELGSKTRWTEILQLNRDKLSDPAALPVGLSLRLPPTRLTLQPAQPTRFRLVSSAGSKLVDGVKVRLFNRSKLLAAAGPFPMDGTNGPVWATSDADGRVVLDTLQKIDPVDAKLGPNVYWFYIDPPTDRRIAGQTVAPRFIGPIQAGEDLGDIELGPFLEARGEIRGTPAELENFAAEWDQPELMKGGPNDKGWDYAVSQPLETERDGDTLTFHLTGLRPGRLRIISNFAPGTTHVSHTYGRRDPGKDEVVFEAELKESVRDIVITPIDPRKTPLSEALPGQDDDARGAWDEPPKTSERVAPRRDFSKLPGRLFVNAGLRTAENETRFVQLAIAIDPNSGGWTRVQSLQADGFTVPISPVRVSPDGRTALFMREKEIWKCDARTGERPERVLEKGSPAAWSPDGKAFFAVVSKKESDYQAVENWKVSTDGGDHSVLALPDADVVEDWSPDGQWLAVMSRKDGQLYVAKPDGSGRRRVTDSDTNASRNDHPRFSPDSLRMVYHRTLYVGEDGASTSHFSLRTIHIDGTGDREILGEEKVDSTAGSTTWTAPMGARWSPDGKHLAVVLFDHDGKGILAINGNWRLAIIDADGGNTRELKLEGVLNTVLPWDGPEWRLVPDAEASTGTRPSSD